MNTLDLAYAAAAAVLVPVWARKARGGWAQRFGLRVGVRGRDRTRPRLLIHAVSVGETNTLRALVPMLREHADVIVSATTDTGLARATALFGPESVVRFPLDFSGAVERFLDAVEPDAVALVELEVWPNFVAQCAQRGIPVAVINGRLSAKSFTNYQRVRRLVSPTFARLNLAAVQDEPYAARFVALGTPARHVRVTGTMKWDSAELESSVPGADELAAAMGIDRSRPLVVAGSTAEGEEALVNEALRAMPEVQLLCAPRKPERFEEAARALPGCVRRSGGSRVSGASRFLLDTIGELRAAYSLADVVVVGRTFAPRRGSDPIEPVALGRATIMGPDYRNFETVTAALRDAGALMICERDQLAGALRDLLNDPARREAMARAGRACVESHRGATRRHAQMLGDLVKSAFARGTKRT
jgi:3-deoxy-D-manno-octulosonic-acid transferase